MKKFINKALEAARKYTIWDWGLLKICLFSLGLLIGLYFAQSLGPYATFVWAFFVFSYVWIAYKTFIQYWNQ